jgi:hypothetical protein
MILRLRLILNLHGMLIIKVDLILQKSPNSLVLKDIYLIQLVLCMDLIKIKFMKEAS